MTEIVEAKEPQSNYPVPVIQYDVVLYDRWVTIMHIKANGCIGIDYHYSRLGDK